MCRRVISNWDISWIYSLITRSKRRHLKEFMEIFMFFSVGYTSLLYLLEVELKLIELNSLHFGNINWRILGIFLKKCFRTNIFVFGFQASRWAYPKQQLTDIWEIFCKNITFLPLFRKRHVFTTKQFTCNI